MNEQMLLVGLLKQRNLPYGQLTWFGHGSPEPKIRIGMTSVLLQPELAVQSY